MPASDSLTVELVPDSEKGRSTVVLRGRFTFAAHAAFREVLMQDLDRMVSDRILTLDLSSVEFVDSAALGMLLLAREAARKRSGKVALRGATGQVQRMLSVSKFETMFLIES